MHIKINKNYLTYDKYKVKCALGKRGIGIKKMEGDKITPIGRYNIKFLLYRKDRIKKIKTKLKKIIIKKNMGWCDDSSSKNYNKLIRLPVKYNHEKLYKSEVINFHPLINTTTITIKTSEFINFLLENKKNVHIFSLDSYSTVKVL